MRDEHLYIVTYDISDPKRWRRVFRLMNGFGEWLQYSVFQCRLSPQRQAELAALLDGIIHHDDDHVLLVDIGPADRIVPRVISLGKDFEPVAANPSLFNVPVVCECSNDGLNPGQRSRSVVL